jgi:hypothetical protein
MRARKAEPSTGPIPIKPNPPRFPPPSPPGFCTTSNQNHCDFFKENSNDTRKVTARHPASITGNNVKMSRGISETEMGIKLFVKRALCVSESPPAYHAI